MTQNGNGMAKIDIKNFNLAELEQFLSGKGKERFRATQIFKWVYQLGATTFGEMTNLSKALREELEEIARISSFTPATVEEGSDGTRKYLFTLDDGEAVEYEVAQGKKGPEAVNVRPC